MSKTKLLKSLACQIVNQINTICIDLGYKFHYYYFVEFYEI